jgi:hypothetical protein
MSELPFKIERELHYRIKGQPSSGKLFIGDIEYLDASRRWACHWSLAHIHPEIGRIYGADSLEALTRTLDFISSLIRGSEEDGLIVWWQVEGDHAGLTFPLCEDQNWSKLPP